MISEMLQANLLGAGQEKCDPYYYFLMFQLYVIIYENVTFSLGEHNGKIVLVGHRITDTPTPIRVKFDFVKSLLF